MQEDEEPVAIDVTAEETEAVPLPAFQQINLTCPDGLKLEFQVEDSVTGVKGDQRRLMVKQSYPYKTSGKHKLVRQSPSNHIIYMYAFEIAELVGTG